MKKNSEKNNSIIQGILSFGGRSRGMLNMLSLRPRGKGLNKLKTTKKNNF